MLDILEIDGSGRYDHYSEGFGCFSSEIEMKFAPIGFSFFGNVGNRH